GRAPVSYSFFAFGVTVGGLIPRIPALKDHLRLTDGQVGLALLGISLGGIVGSLVSRLLIRHHAATGVRAGILILCVAGVGPALAGSLGALVAAFFVIGFLWGFIDVLENGFGARLEHTYSRPLINGLHGFWSLGAFVGSLIAGGAALVGLPPLVQFIATGVVMAAASVWVLRGLAGLSAVSEASPAFGAVAFTSALAALAGMSFAGVIAEGGTSDWSALFLRELSHASQGIAAAGFSGFSIAAMLVRFRADRLTARTNARTVVRLGAILAAAGLLLAIALPALPVAIIGFTIVGVGTAVLLPLTFAAGANLSRGGGALAVVLASTYAGTIAGPPLIGVAADHVGLRFALFIPLVAALAVFALGGTVGFPGAGEARRKGSAG
ncbi:MAG TPA: MFS transporter, partial [Solirubrobacteraceae bacterium]